MAKKINLIKHEKLQYALKFLKLQIYIIKQVFLSLKIIPYILTMA